MSKKRNPPGLGFEDRQPQYSGATASTASRAPSEPSPAVVRRPFQPDPELVQLGVRMAVEIIHGRSWETMRPYFADANAKDETTRQHGTAVLLGFAMQSASFLGVIENSGLAKFAGHPLMTSEDVTYAFKCDQSRFLAALNAISETLARTLKVIPSLKGAKRVAEQAEEKPLRVEVVSMPARETATKIRRDQAGDIISTVQLEQDVAK